MDQKQSLEILKVTEKQFPNLTDAHETCFVTSDRKPDLKNCDKRKWSPSKEKSKISIFKVFVISLFNYFFFCFV